MREEIGVFDFPCWVRRGTYRFFVEDGVLKLEKAQRNEASDIKEVIGTRYFNDAGYFKHCDSGMLPGILLMCEGLPVSVLDREMEQFNIRREARAKRYEEEAARWENLKSRFGGMVIGIGKDVDVFDTGFSVRVIFRSDLSFADRKKFLQESKRKFLEWVMFEVRRDFRIKQKIGDFGFYKPVEIVNLRVPEVEVKFEVKKEVAL